MGKVVFTMNPKFRKSKSFFLLPIGITGWILQKLGYPSTERRVPELLAEFRNNYPMVGCLGLMT
jgi:hypothetical protein